MNILNNVFLSDSGSSNGGEATGSSGILGYLPMIIIVGLIILFFVWQWKKSKKQQREAQDMLNSIAIGDEIITIGGIEGRVVRIKDDHITIESGRDRTKLSITRSAVANVMKKQENVVVKDTATDKPEIKNA
ncbi:MAG: preprotein translocase subunit YajC [Clostridia bacterium]|nr:preprotein translocase subunit YajC [Clostridia bacterium]